MASGLSIPMRVVRGRGVIDSGERQMAKLISLAMTEGESDNPFNDDAGIQVPVFDVNLPSTRALVRREIEHHFRRFEADERASLERIETSEGDGEMIVDLWYIDMETDERHEISKTLRRV